MNKSITVVIVILILAAMIMFFYKPKGAVTSEIKGEPLRLEMQAQSVSDLAGVQADVVYDQGVVRYVGVTKGAFLEGGKPSDAMLLDTVDVSTPGAVRGIVVVRLAPIGVSGSGVVATVHFIRIKDGDAHIQLQNVLLSDSAVHALPASSITGAIVSE